MPPTRPFLALCWWISRLPWNRCSLIKTRYSLNPLHLLTFRLYIKFTRTKSFCRDYDWRYTTRAVICVASHSGSGVAIDIFRRRRGVSSLAWQRQHVRVETFGGENEVGNKWSLPRSSPRPSHAHGKFHFISFWEIMFLSLVDTAILVFYIVFRTFSSC